QAGPQKDRAGTGRAGSVHQSSSFVSWLGTVSHSLRSASIGDSRAARAAGYTPKPTPITIATAIEISTQGTEIVMGLEMKWGRINAPPTPPATPSKPPVSPRMDAS